MTVLMSGMNMYAMAMVLQVVLGWDIHFSIWVASITVAIYVVLGGLRSAIFNEVLQFVLIWAGAMLVPILGLIEAGGWTNLKAQIAHNASAEYTHLWSTLGNFNDNPMGINWVGIVFGLVRDLRGLLDDGLPGGAARSRGQGPALGEAGSDYRSCFQDGSAVYRHSAWSSGARGAADDKLFPKAGTAAIQDGTATTTCFR